MMLKAQLRFWRVLLWGLITFLLSSASFWNSFVAFTSFLIRNKAAQARLLPSPILPSIFSGMLALLLVYLGIAGIWWLRLWRKPASRPVSFAAYGGNGELCARLLLLVLLLTASSCLPYTSHLVTGRCSLFTAEVTCAKYSDGLPDGSYNFSSYNGQNAGVYPPTERKLLKVGRVWLDRFSLEDLQVERTRFGWPAQGITRDVVSNRPEWHIVLETWTTVNQFLWFLGWLFIQPIITLANRRLLRQS